MILSISPCHNIQTPQTHKNLASTVTRKPSHMDMVTHEDSCLGVRPVYLLDFKAQGH